MDYFKKLPTLLYDKVPAKNILARADLDKISRNNLYSFYPYTMEEGDRADTIAYNYYEESGFDWLLYFANDIIDPYYDLNINDDNFQRYIEKKYGSLADASVNIKHYKNNWAENSDQLLTISGYNALPANLKKYWDPIVNENYQIISYKRKNADWILNTNRIAQLTIVPNSNTEPFGFADLVSNGSASGTCVFSNSTCITVQHIVGEFTDSAYQVTSRYSNNTANVVSSNIITENMDAAEEIYYSPVSYLDYEEEQNMKKKEIVLIDNRYANKAASELKRVMSTNGR